MRQREPGRSQHKQLVQLHNDPGKDIERLVDHSSSLTPARAHNRDTERHRTFVCYLRRNLELNSFSSEEMLPLCSSREPPHYPSSPPPADLPGGSPAGQGAGGALPSRPRQPQQIRPPGEARSPAMAVASLLVNRGCMHRRFLIKKTWLYAFSYAQSGISLVICRSLVFLFLGFLSL